MTKILLSASPKVLTVSGQVFFDACIFHGFTLGTDGLFDPTITVYNNTVGSGVKVVPTCTFDASALGMNGVTGVHQYCDKGLYIDITCSGTVEVVVQYTPYRFQKELSVQI